MKTCMNCDQLIDDDCIHCPYCDHYVGQNENL